MIEMKADEEFVEIVASETLTASDYERMVPRLEELAEEHGPLRLYIELKDFRGWTPAGLWEDIRFDFSHQDEMERIAVVGESSWEEWGTKISKPFFKAEMRFFPRSEAANARRWVRAG